MNAVEKSILSGIVQHENNALLDISDLISVKHFNDRHNQLIYKILCDILDNDLKIDFPTVKNFASKYNFKLDEDYVDSLFTESIKLDNIRQYAKILVKLDLIKECSNAHKRAFEELKKLNGTETVDKILSISEEPIFNIFYEGDNQPIQIAQNYEVYLKSKEENDGNTLGIPTPFSKFNTVIGGGLRNGVTLISSRAKVGKSSFAKEVALSLVEQNIPVLYIDTEMTEKEQLDRCISSRTNIDLTDIETGKFVRDQIDKHKVESFIQKLSKMPFYHKYVGGKSFEEILSIIRRWLFKHVGINNGSINNCLVIYDYFKLMSDEKLKEMQEYQALGFQISSLTDFCKQYNFPCLSFVQLNREGIKNDSTSSIAQSDRLVWLCLSVSIFKRKTKEELAVTGHHGNMKLIPLESRFGPGLEEGDYINIYFNKSKSIMTEGNTYFSTQKQEEMDEEWTN